LTSGDTSSCTTWLAGAMNSFSKKYTICTLEPNDQIHQAYLLGSILASS
jgi:hypothetical protein